MCLHASIVLLIILLLSKVCCRSSSSSYCSANDVFVLSKDDNTTTTSVPSETFEFGFFGNSNGRYFGVRHNRSGVAVWVANRNDPLPKSNGCFVLRAGNLMVIDMEGKVYWSSPLKASGRTLKESMFGNTQTSYDSNVRRLQLDDYGDLTFSDGKQSWESFDYPTDTLLYGMNLDEHLSLTSWRTTDDPAKGSFTLQVRSGELSISNGGSNLWQNGADVPPNVSDALGNSLQDNSTRWVMNYTGKLQAWKWEEGRGWSLVWSVPKDDECSLFNKCGNYGSCNSENKELCKCLPGFEPNEPDKWKHGNFLDGCSSLADFDSEYFLRLPMMKVGGYNFYNNSYTNEDCQSQCKKDGHCVAYSCGQVDCTEIGLLNNTRCWSWSAVELTDLQEEYPGGITLFVRTRNPALTPRDCNPCGTIVIPYPLSTEANCGDPSYFNFICNASTGELGFIMSNATLRVTEINPKANTFTIQTMNSSNCDTRHLESLVLSPNSSFLLKNKSCSLVNQSSSEVKESLIEVEMGWKPPLEFPCNTSQDCVQWPYATCKLAAGGKKRCICGSHFQWDGFNLTCQIGPRKTVQFLLKVVVAPICGAMAVVLLCGIVYIHYARKRRMARKQGSVELQGDDIDIGSIDVPFFDWGSVLTATNNFADVNKLGTGGFGTVYKGVLPDGKEIAVKRLSVVSEQGVGEFKTEVVLIAKLQHRNLVRLLGYCVKAAERILLYEFMQNGSLDSCFFDQTHSVFLDWEKRFDIIFGIARGLLYLHQDSRLRIIHRDLKPSNILLDEEMNPKISDFGIARIVGGNETEGSTKRVVGTYGYMAPEYAYEGLFSVKSDVFSFGVVVLEAISGRRNSKLFQAEHGMNLQGYAWKLWNEEKGMDLMEETLKELCNESEVLKCIHIGLLCVQEDPSDRPTMSAVVLMLGSESSSLPSPKQPAFISNKKETSETASSSSRMDLGFNDMLTFSTAGR